MTRRELGGRYRLEEEIGGGGMALVYRAVDTILDRTVAIKMLRPQYVDDAQFVSRFRQEAQSAAKLSHPNIVNLYDVGVEDKEYYIVMEYVDGPTLKDIIHERAPLPISEVVDITNQICAALEHAHEHHIIHRDIKPHNILLTKNGIVKVADFGIARAVTGDTITDFQATTVLGSVHYISPEQARGGTTDVKSDIYSLGVVMYEMLTNQLPFSGDSPVSVALKHLRDRFVEPRELNRKIPQSIENIVLKCLVKSPDMRYENMSAMRADLNDALIHPNVPKFTMPLDVDDRTISIPAIGSVASQTSKDVRTDNKRKKPWWKTLMWWFVAMMLVLVGGFAAYYILMRFIQVPNENLPNVIGKTEQQAVESLKAAGFQSNQIQEEKAVNSDKPAGIVYDQNPPGPTVVKKGRDITLYISLGAPKISMPNVLGVVADQAVQTLVNQGFKRQNITEQQVQSTDVPAGQVVSSSPASGENVSTDVKVTLQVSSGAMTQVPNVVGMAYADAVQALQAANLQIGQVTRMPFSAQDQTVFKISPYSVGQPVPDGTAINLFVVDNSSSQNGNTNQQTNGTNGTQNSNLPSDTEVRPVPIHVHVKRNSQVQVAILVSDARGSDQKEVEESVSRDSSWTVDVYVTPNTSGNIQVLENGNVTQNWNVAYQ